MSAKTDNSASAVEGFIRAAIGFAKRSRESSSRLRVNASQGKARRDGGDEATLGG